MSRGERALFHVANGLVVGTGLIYAWMLYALEPQDEYALVNHPLQSEVQHAHVLVAPSLILLLGVLWRSHVAPQLRSRQRARRTSGIALLALAGPMILSGYALQVSSEPSWREAWIAAHVGASALWIAALGTHLLARRRSAAAQIDAAPSVAIRRRARSVERARRVLPSGAGPDRPAVRGADLGVDCEARESPAR